MTLKLRMLVCVIASLVTGGINAEEVDWSIPFRTEPFTPEAGEIDLSFAAGDTTTDPLHVFVQLFRPPAVEDRDLLADNDIRLLQRVHKTTYAAAISRSRIDSLISGGFAGAPEVVRDRVRWIGSVEWRAKLSQEVLDRTFPDHAVREDGRIELVVVFYDDITERQARRFLRYFDPDRRTFGNGWLIALPVDRIEELADNDWVKLVEVALTRVILLNDASREVTRTDDVQGGDFTGTNPTYGGQSGTGISVAIMDEAMDPDHDDFFDHDDEGNRVTRIDHHTGGSPGHHGTHVAGIVGGNGYQSNRNDAADVSNDGDAYQWRGMAPNLRYLSFELLVPAIDPEIYHDAIVSEEADLSNHSYVQTCTGYSSGSQTVDEVVRGDAEHAGVAVPPRPVVWAAGNQGFFDWDCGGIGPAGYFSILSEAKNPIVVGAVHGDNPEARWMHSSMGPTRDGRLKPDVVAPGCTQSGVYAGIKSTRAENNGYVRDCGTSMAAPAVSGIVALLMQQWRETFGEGADCSTGESGACYPYPSTIKAVLIQTATDLVDLVDESGEWPNPDTGVPVRYHAGPDWATGYGLVNALKARDLVATGPGPDRQIVESEILEAGQVDSYSIEVPAKVAEMRVTLAWDDPAGAPSFPDSPKLENNLDLKLYDGDVEHLPWVVPALPPGFTAADIKPAEPGLDDLNNVEQVWVKKPGAGTWRIQVIGTSLALDATQKYSLTADFPMSGAGMVAQPVFTGFDKCIEIDWTPKAGGFTISLPETDPHSCGLIPIGPLCRYALDCPPCVGGLCPGYDLNFTGLPENLRISSRDSFGKETGSLSKNKLPVDGNSRFVAFEPDPNVVVAGGSHVLDVKVKKK